MAYVLLTKIPHHHGIYYKLTEFRVTHIRRYKNSFFGLINSFQIIWDYEIANTELMRFNYYSIRGKIKLAFY